MDWEMGHGKGGRGKGEGREGGGDDVMGGLLLRMTFCDGIRILSDGIDDGTACDKARSWIGIV